MSDVFFAEPYEKKFDLQLAQGLRHEHKLAEIIKGDKIEVKSESYIWERTGNICIEYRHNGKPSGIAATEAQTWVHVLLNEDKEVVVWLGFPIERLKELARQAIRAGRVHKNAGDGGLSEVALVSLSDVLKTTR